MMSCWLNGRSRLSFLSTDARMRREESSDGNRKVMDTVPDDGTSKTVGDAMGTPFAGGVARGTLELFAGVIGFAPLFPVPLTKASASSESSRVCNAALSVRRGLSEQSIK